MLLLFCCCFIVKRLLFLCYKVFFNVLNKINIKKKILVGLKNWLIVRKFVVLVNI